VVVVAGARQVGKSTLLNHVFATAESVVFDPSVDVGNARADPDLFLDTHPPPLILDEIQYAPELVGALKRRVDRDQRAQSYLITGSQQWQVLLRVAESLAGRAVFVDLEGFCLAELGSVDARGSWLERFVTAPEAFVEEKVERHRLTQNPYELVWRGSLPAATQLPIDLVHDFHAAYFRTYVERDVRLLQELSDWHQFGRFVRIVAALTAREVNYSHLGRDIGLTPQTVRRWLQLLRATFQWHEVPAFSGNATKRVSGKPKGYLADTGMACAAQAISSPSALGGHPLLGPLFETYVAGELRKHMALLSPPPQLYHFRSAGGAEVDFVLERDGRYFPIEVKVKSRPSRIDASGLRAFRAAYPHLALAPGLDQVATSQLARAEPSETTVADSLTLPPIPRTEERPGVLRGRTHSFWLWTGPTDLRQGSDISSRP